MIGFVRQSANGNNGHNRRSLSRSTVTVGADTHDRLARVDRLLTKMMESARRDTNGIKLPPAPEQIEPQLNADHPVPLCNSE